MTAGPCTRCGAPLTPGVKFCERCGAPVSESGASAPPPPPPPVAPVATQVFPTAPPPPGAGPSAPNKKRNLLIAVAGAAVIALIAGLVLISRDDKESAETVGGAAEIFLEPATAVGDDPFTATVDTNSAPAPVRLRPPHTPPQTTATSTTTPQTTVAPTTTAVPTQTVRSVSATAPGLYGGTRNNAACDQELMISYLTDNPAKAAAWAGVQGIATTDIPTFIRSLTPMVLRADTRVTNYGFRNGVANPKQTILQMGTAVLVDEYGIPRARCFCGNPLAPPVAQTTGTRWVGDPWPGFDPTTVIIVVNVSMVVITEFVVVDLNGGYFARLPPKSSPTGTFSDGEIFVDSLCDLFPEAPECQPTVETTIVETTIPEPELGTGDIQFTLRWSSTADLDLAVLDPNGEEISYSNRSSSSGGELDVDSNADCSTAVANPVENIFWAAGQSPDGTYQIAVTYYGECGSGTGPQTYTLTALVDGVPVELESVVAGLRQTTGTLNSPGDRHMLSYAKDPSRPIVTAAPTVPSTAAPTATPATTPTSRVPVTTVAPVGATPTTAQPGETISLDEYCAAKYPPPDDFTNMMWVLCMHDPTVNSVDP